LDRYVELYIVRFSTYRLICDQLVELVGFYPHQGDPERLRRVVNRDPERNKRLVFLTNHLSLPNERTMT
jgi:hypothetical protein